MGEGGRCVRLTTLLPSCAVVTKSGTLRGLPRSVMVLLYLLLYLVNAPSRQTTFHFISSVIARTQGGCHKQGQPPTINSSAPHSYDILTLDSDAATAQTCLSCTLFVLVPFPPDFATHRFLPKTCVQKKKLLHFSFLALFVRKTCSYTIRDNA